MEEMKTVFFSLYRYVCSTVFFICIECSTKMEERDRDRERRERDWYYTDQSLSLREVQGSNLRNAIERNTERERERERERKERESETQRIAHQ